ncbi:unnamed protein product [Musa banksii]
MMAVITMHKMMSLLMTGSENGSVLVVQAACKIGDAIEREYRSCTVWFIDTILIHFCNCSVGLNQGRIHRFMEKTREKRDKDKRSEDAGYTVTREQESLRKKVLKLMKKQKPHQVRKLVSGEDDSKPWGQGLTIITKEQQKLIRRFGVIECDPVVRQGLDRTARHMVIPYMPMLIPPVNWKSYDRGAYLFLPSYIMRTHGSRQQREAVRRAPREQMQAIFELAHICFVIFFGHTYINKVSANQALDTLGNTKWRVN